MTDPLSVHHMNELFSIHHHISLVGEAWKFLHQVRQILPHLQRANVAFAALSSTLEEKKITIDSVLLMGVLD